MAGDGGEVVMVDPETVMGLGERATLVAIGAAEDLRHQEHLVALESSHVDLFKVRRKLRVSKNPHVEIVHDSAHGRPPAYGVVVTDRSSNRLISHGFPVLPPREANGYRKITNLVWSSRRGLSAFHDAGLQLPRSPHLWVDDGGRCVRIESRVQRLGPHAGGGAGLRFPRFPGGSRSWSDWAKGGADCD
jgi:hypothetical protein